MDTTSIVILSFLGASGYLAINYFIARQFQDVAEAKEWYDKKYFWICFLLGICGWLLVIALPDRRKTTAVVPETICNSKNEEDIPEL